MAGQRSPPLGKTMSQLRGSKSFLPHLLDTVSLLSVAIILCPGGLSHRGREPWRDLSCVSALPGRPVKEMGQATSDSD